jgi:hypothetical protein
MVEAAAQRWNRYVIDEQTKLVRWFGFRHGAGKGRTRWEALRSPLAAVALAALLAPALMRWFRRRRGKPTRPTTGAPESPAAAQVVSLYRSLEVAMAARGVPRVQSTPPLMHAEALSAVSHPIAGEVLDLTHRYLEVRYAGHVLSESERREFVRRVKQVQLDVAGPDRATPAAPQ